MEHRTDLYVWRGGVEFRLSKILTVLYFLI